jgi:hypothetical protein
MDVGLDVSLKQTSICVVNQLGSVVGEGVVDSEPEAIAAFVRSKAPRVVRIGLETGPTATWLWTELKRLDLPVICIDARHAKAVLKMRINKSDRNDAVGIARIMQTGWFREVRVNRARSPAPVDRVAGIERPTVGADVHGEALRFLVFFLGVVAGRAQRLQRPGPEGIPIATVLVEIDPALAVGMALNLTGVIEHGQPFAASAIAWPIASPLSALAWSSQPVAIRGRVS